MLQDIINAWQEGKHNLSDSPTFTCKYCNKHYRKESTLLAHQCEPKRRWQQEKEAGVQVGLLAYLRFYELTQGSSKTKSYADFVSSQYYTAFVKFGRHVRDIRAVNPKQFIDYVITKNKKIDFWCHDSTYMEYLTQYLKKEAVQDALERALLEMQSYADSHPELRNGFKDYFKYGSPNRICYDIVNGRISPWVVYNCSSGVEFLETLNDEQIALIIDSIDPSIWHNKFNLYVSDTEWIRSVLEQAGL